MKHGVLLIMVLLLELTEGILNCPDGFKIKGRECEDEDECAEGFCGENSNCTNTIGSYYCQCKEGYGPPGNFTHVNGTTCQLINPCHKNSIGCGPNASCDIASESYFCICKDGYINNKGTETFKAGQGVQCVDRDECTDDPSICEINAVCHNTHGSYYCTCKAGFRLKSGQTNFTYPDEHCQSECDIDKSFCGDGGDCHNRNNGRECVCKAGFTNYGVKKMRCTELKCDRFKSNNYTSQASPELTKMASLMTNCCLILTGNNAVKKEQLDGRKLLEAFLHALDELLRHGLQGDNKKASAMFGIMESTLKLIPAFLSDNHTRMSTNRTEIEVFVEKGNPAPSGPLMISTSNTQFFSHWETATGNTNLGFTTAALLSYKDLEKSLNNKLTDLEKQEFTTLKINSEIVTVTVTNDKTDLLDKPVILTFSHKQHMEEKHMCVFWDTVHHAWSTQGCTTVNSSADQTVCSCQHLSSFAVLMALSDIGDVYELRLITWTGLSLSLVCLLICILTFHLVRSIQSTRNTIHFHLSISLFIAYFVFLVGITRTENEMGCAFVAGLLHYFFLAAFCWMCLEGVQLFRMVVLVFNTTLRPVYMFAAGYGVPAVIVAVSAAVNVNGYMPHENKRYCWLSLEDGFIWSFFGPVCIIIIVNVFFFLITIWKLAEKFSSLNPDLNNLRKIKTFLITAIAQLCVLGLMWIFGCFQFDKGMLAMSYIFTILSSLQGVLIFIMHCWLSKQVREEYAKFLSCICTPQKRKYSEFSSNQTSKSQASKSVQHTGESHI